MTFVYIIKIKDSGDDNYGQYDRYYRVNTKVQELEFSRRFKRIRDRRIEESNDGMDSEITNDAILDEMVDNGDIEKYIEITQDFELEN